MVTHDRYFMDRLVDHVFVFTGQGQVRDIHGNYTEYRTLIETEKKEVQANKERTVVSKPAENKTASKKLSYNEVRELAQLEKDLADLEVQKAGLISQMGTPLPHIELQELTKKYEAALLLIETKTMRWLTLAEMA